MHEIAPLHLAEVGHDQVRVVGGETGPSADFGLPLVVQGLQLGPLGLQVHVIAPLDPAEIGPDQSRVKGRDTEPSVPHTSHMIDG